MTIGFEPTSEDEIFSRLAEVRRRDLNTKGGRTWAYVYDPGRTDIDQVAKRALVEMYDENALDPTVFPSLVQLENEVVGAARRHLRGDDDVVGHFTTGGTESILLAVKAARDAADARARVPVRRTIVAPVTAHAAFHKAAHYLGMDVITTACDPVTWKADPIAIAEAIDERTALIVGSAVSYAHGVIDPITEIGQIALDNDVLFHVDGCIGGFILPYARQLGRRTADFDFTVAGVTSISMDFHKYAYCPKGASVVLYRNAELRRHQLFAKAAWTGYTVINTTVQSTKSGGALAATWATLQFVGDDGYLAIAERTLAAVDRICGGIARSDHLDVMVEPEANLVALVSDTVSVFDVVDEMRARNWYVQPQLGFAGSRENIHLSVGGASLALVPELLADLEASATAAAANPTAGPDPAVVEMLTGLDPASLGGDGFDLLLAGAGLDSSDGTPDIPDRTAGINALLDASPADLAEQVLIEYFNRLYVPGPNQ